MSQNDSNPTLLIIKCIHIIKQSGGETMHLMPVWYPYIDWDKSDMKVKVLMPDTPQEIKDAFEKYQEELKKPVNGYVIKQYFLKGLILNRIRFIKVELRGSHVVMEVSFKVFVTDL